MFEIKDVNNRLPIKVWLSDESTLEANCRTQADNLAKLPMLYSHVCLMPDCHAGKGMPIGGVIAAKNAIIPNAVGTDIGCGMAFCATNINVDSIRDVQTGNGTIIQAIISEVMRNVPVGREKQRKPQPSACIDRAKENISLYVSESELLPLFDEGYYQIGTLGGGNHFIELQEDESGYLCVMIHSGSRHLGVGICEHFNKIAVKNASLWGSEVAEEYGLSYLPADLDDGKNYIEWMKLALDYAYENRRIMMKQVCESIVRKVGKFTGQTVVFGDELDCHHNYASLELHGGEAVWVHRKGAISAGEDEKAVIPGAMGSYSYVVCGKGNPLSFNSASHGAGRKYSRSKASEIFTVEQVVVDLKSEGVILGKRSKNDVTEECRQAYKDIDEVIAQEADLVTPIRKLKTVGVVKG